MLYLVGNTQGLLSTATMWGKASQILACHVLAMGLGCEDQVLLSKNIPADPNGASDTGFQQKLLTTAKRVGGQKSNARLWGHEDYGWLWFLIVFGHFRALVPDGARSRSAHPPLCVCRNVHFDALRGPVRTMCRNCVFRGHVFHSFFGLQAKAMNNSNIKKRHKQVHQLQLGQACDIHLLRQVYSLFNICF